MRLIFEYIQNNILIIIIYSNKIRWHNTLNLREINEAERFCLIKKNHITVMYKIYVRMYVSLYMTYSFIQKNQSGFTKSLRAQLTDVSLN